MNVQTFSLNIQFRKIPIISTFFLEFLFHIIFTLLFFKHSFYIIKNSQKKRTKMPEFRNSNLNFAPKTGNSIPKIPIF